MKLDDKHEAAKGYPLGGHLGSISLLSCSTFLAHSYARPAALFC